MKTAMLALILAVSASAQYTIVVSTDAHSDGSTAHESVTLSSTSNCPGCGNSNMSHTFTGSLVESLTGRQCTFSGGGPIIYNYNMGCALDIPVIPGVSQTFTASSTIRGICSIAGAFFSVMVNLQPVKITNAYSSYFVYGCFKIIGPGNFWSCNVSPSGTGCPGKCSTSTTKLSLGSPDLYAQCKDIIVNGTCVSQLCANQTRPGFCTSGPVN